MLNANSFISLCWICVWYYHHMYVIQHCLNGWTSSGFARDEWERMGLAHAVGMRKSTFIYITSQMKSRIILLKDGNCFVLMTHTFVLENNKRTNDDGAVMVGWSGQTELWMRCALKICIRIVNCCITNITNTSAPFHIWSHPISINFQYKTTAY